MNNNYIKLNKISKEYHSKNMPSVRALNEVSFSLPQRGLFFVIGKSGSGKSTLLNIIGGIDVPTEGVLEINGETVDYSDEKSLNAYRSQMVGFIFQEYNLIEDFNIRDNVKLPLLSDGREVDEGEIDRLLDAVGIGDLKDKTPSCLSGGERQRTAIVRALAKKPKILLADEPTGNLDSESSRLIFELLKKLSLDMPIIVVTHDVRAAYEFADRIILLNKGKKTEDLIKNHHDDTNEIKVEHERRLKNMFSENQSEDVLPSQKQAHFEKMGRMPLSSAFFIAFAQLKRRISYTVLSIIIFALILGGLGIVRTCASFDGVSSFAHLIKRNGFRTVGLALGEINEYNDIIYEGEAFSYDDYVSLKNKYGNAYKVYNFNYSLERYVYDIEDIKNDKNKFANIQGICELDGEMGDRELEMFYGAKLVLGSYPKTSADAVEILISDTLADDILSAGAYFEDEIVYPSGTYESIIGKSIVYESVKFKIVGIYTYRYADAAASDKTGLVYDKLRFFAWQYVSPVAITNGGAIERQIKKHDAFSGLLNVIDDNVEIPRQISTAFIPVNNIAGVESLAEEYGVSFVLANEEKDFILNNEILISYQLYCQLFSKYEFDALGDPINAFDKITPEDLEELKFTVSLSDNEYQEYKVIGVFDDVDEYANVAVVNNANYDRTINYLFDYAAILVSAESYDEEQLVRELNGGGTVILLPENESMLQAETWFSISKSTMTLVTVLLAFLVILVMYFIISMNIRDNRKTIGILRTFGVTRNEFLMIYLIIDIAYFVFGFLLSCGLYFLGCHVINILMSYSRGLEMAFLIADHISVLIMLLVAIVSLIVSSIIPILRYIHQSPDRIIRKEG